MINLDEVKEFAAKAHEGQTRKYTGEPYFVHCAEVAGIVASVGGSMVMVAAAYLHDTVEDTSVTLDEIEKRFGIEVAEMVSDLTDVSKASDGNRACRKALDRAHTGRASPDAKTVKLADLISNSRTIQQHDRDFAKVYMAEKRELLKVLTEGNQTLMARATGIVNHYYELRVFWETFFPGKF